ncbi:PaaI family thioesterase [Fructilactobacillus carniphilus]|uniref:PaaI family thioesterase n=1 Tax=Fructilactobacillus carniphilus TaxID=2940297 RepID=A0ABY5BVH7_9LACO|nr:PaaI family thioesterase [Fructilactobacillus carniphilus]USS90500.1 PaaI family thioesterase [Fructilactobacillus carniphilus]
MNLLELLNIQTELVTPKRVVLTLDVTEQDQQPYGLMHGGISCVLAETAASIGANQLLGEHEAAVGVNIETHHLKAVRTGLVTAVATPLQQGHRLQVWQVNVQHHDQLVSTSTVTLTKQSLGDQ